MLEIRRSNIECLFIEYLKSEASTFEIKAS